MLLWQIFVLFTRVALFSWGGGPASMALMQRETMLATWTPPGAAAPVSWATPEEFADALAVSNALPGPIAPQVAAYIGYKLAGLPGAVAATAGTVLPSTILMLVMMVFFFKIKDSHMAQAMLKAVRPVIVGLLLWTTYSMAATIFNVHKLGVKHALAQGWDALLIALISFAILTLTKWNPVFILLGAAIFGAVAYR